jgi:hypothetical protein
LPTPRTSAREKPRSVPRTSVRTQDVRVKIGAEFGHPKSDPPQQDQETPKIDIEKLASQKLKLAKRLLESGRRSAAVAWLKDIICQFQQTVASKEARKLLEQLGETFVDDDCPNLEREEKQSTKPEAAPSTR